MLFGIGNGAEFQPQNWVIKSPLRVLDPYYTMDEIYQILHEYYGSLHLSDTEYYGSLNPRPPISASFSKKSRT